MGKPNSSVWYSMAPVAACLLASATASAADPTIDAFEAAQQAAWNAHDADAYTAAFDKDATIVTALGWRWNGRAEAARKLGDGFKFVYARARLQVSAVQIRALTPELAAVTLNWSIDGAQPLGAAQQAGEQRGFETQLLQRQGASWMVLSQQDTAALPLPAPLQATERAAPPASFPLTPPPVRRCILARANHDCLIYGKAQPAP